MSDQEQEPAPEGPPTEQDIEQQVTMLTNAIQKKPAAIGFAALDSKASAPLTTSMISLVMLAWRTRFINNVSLSIISDAFEVAASIAVIRAACSLAADSNSAR